MSKHVRYIAVLVLVLQAVLTACTSNESRLAGITGPDTTGGALEKATLTVTVTSTDTALMTVLGLDVLDSLTVTVQRRGSAAISTSKGGDDGVVLLANLLPGTYDISASRVLTPHERSLLPPHAQDVDAFGGAASVSVVAPSTSVTLPVIPGRRGSLVISELYRGHPWVGTSYYVHGHFLELYNNSDTSIDLSRVIVAKGFPGVRRTPIYDCTPYTAFIGDSLGVWSGYIYAFPTQASFLAPGQHVVIATDAIDHTALAAGTFDLSTASYEFAGSQDVDNPAVPNMISIGPRPGETILGHGLHFYEIEEATVLAFDVDITVLPAATTPNGDPYVRIPTDKVLDVVSTLWSGSNPSDRCGPAVLHPALDGQQFSLEDITDRRSLQRRALYRRNDGRRVLQRTKTSAQDFWVTSGTPGTIP